jgi:hypothetical protein
MSTAEEVMPRLQEELSVQPDEALHLSQLAGLESIRAYQSDRREPKLGRATGGFNMNMGGLGTLVAVVENPPAAVSENGWDQAGPRPELPCCIARLVRRSSTYGWVRPGIAGNLASLYRDRPVETDD